MIDRIDPVEMFEEDLNSFDPGERGAALQQLLRRFRPVPASHSNVNMHLHSFFSYNAEGWSPTRIAWEARKAGLYAAGLCDFDVLDGLEEFLHAGLALGLRTAVNLETRAYVKEFADLDISSPGEPGVTYIMGAGFVEEPDPDSPEGKDLAAYRERARQRNVALITRINPHLPQIAVDYQQDVIPLTPAGVATERHIVSAYVNKAKSVYGQPDAVAGFWAKLFGISFEEAVILMADTASLEELLRAKLVKRGGVGYEQPSVGTFPPVDDFIKWVLSCQAIPMHTWLDGTSGGEKDGRVLLECMKAKGVAALNIIPDRNWNVSDSASRAVKTANLKAIVETAEDMELPINIGTEMNKLGLPFVDDLDCEALRPYKDIFLRGARIMVGHTVLARYAGLSYTGARAAAEFKTVSDKNTFFEAIGGLPPMNLEQAEKLEDAGEEKALALLREQI